MATLASIWTTGTGGGAALPAAGDEGARALRWQQWLEAAEGEGEELAGFARAARDTPAIAALLDGVFGHSPFLSKGAIADPGFARLLIEQGPDAGFALALDAAHDRARLGEETQAEAMKRLRVAKRRAALTIALADIASVWPLEKLTGALSQFAAASLGAVCRHLLRALHDGGRLALPQPDSPEEGCALIVLGMGKLGGGELNYSSDVDVILLYDEERLGEAARARAGRLFAKLARDLVQIMEQRTVDGYVFRTDLRLRPDPGSTPPAVSVAAALRYYASQGRTWERAAMIKARPVAGDREAGEAFLEALRPFVWRRYLDFATIQDVGALKRQIDAQRGGGEAALAGHNVKLGRGGIREIEFFAQTQQLVWGGRDAALRGRRTEDTLDALVAARRLASGAAAELKAAYRFHRRVEHRLQMTDDRQTQTLPEDEEGLGRTARFLGYDGVAGFGDDLRAHMRAVERHYATLFEERPGRASEGALDVAALATEKGGAALAAAGYRDGARALEILAAWQGGEHRASRDPRARELLAKLAPGLLQAFAAWPRPDAALGRFDAFLAGLPAARRTLSLLAAHPELIGLVAEIMAAAPRLAEAVGRHPTLLDSVLSRDFTDLELPEDLGLEATLADNARRGLVRLFYAREFDLEQLRQELAAAVGEMGGESGGAAGQELLDAQRRWAAERGFRIGVHLLRGLVTPVEAGRPLADIADACLGRLLPAIADAMAERHGRIAGGRVALVAFGDLGRRELDSGSELDLMLIYDHDSGHDSDAANSDGRRPLAAPDYYRRLASRLVAAISAPTGEGRLYGIDMRPRPSGHAGPVVASLAAFADRQRDAALWERRALAGARVVYGEGDLGERFAAIRRDALTWPGGRAELAAASGEERRQLRARGARSVTDMPGGLADLALGAGFLHLLHPAPETLDGATGSVMRAAGEAGLIGRAAADELAEAAALWRNLRGMLRLTVAGDALVGDAGGGDRGASDGSDSIEGDLGPAIARVVGRSCGALLLDSLDRTVRETAAATASRLDALLDAGGGR